MKLTCLSLLFFITFSGLCWAQDLQSVKKRGSLIFVPIGDSYVDQLLYEANGGAFTTNDSFVHTSGIKIKLIWSDRIDEQIESVKAGDTPFIRCNSSQKDLLEAVLGDNVQPFICMGETIPYFIVVKDSENNYNLQQNKIKLPPKASLAIAKLSPAIPDVATMLGLSGDKYWENDVLGDVVVWTESNKKSVQLFMSDPKIKAVVVPFHDMILLTGGPGLLGTGLEGTIKGARSVALHKYSDWYYVKTNWAQTNKDWLEVFAKVCLSLKRDSYTKRLFPRMTKYDMDYLSLFYTRFNLEQQQELKDE